MIQLGEHFRDDNHRRHSEWLRQQRWFIKARQDQIRKDDLINKAEEEVLDFAANAAVATQAQMIEFENDLDSYDTAITTALLENEKVLEVLFLQRNAILAKAHVLEDGRRVFKSDDGTYVIDEHRQMLTPEECDPDSIPDHLPRASAFIKIDDAYQQAEVEKQKLTDALERNDEAREWAKEPGRTGEELDERKARLFDKLPASAKVHLPEEVLKRVSGMEKEPESSADKTADATDKLDIPSDMVPTAMTLKM